MLENMASFGLNELPVRLPSPVTAGTHSGQVSIVTGEYALKIDHVSRDHRACGEVSPISDSHAKAGNKTCTEWPLLNRHLGQLEALESRDVELYRVSRAIPGEKGAGVPMKYECFALCALQGFDCWDLVAAYQVRLAEWNYAESDYASLEMAKIKIADAVLQGMHIPTEPPAYAPATKKRKGREPMPSLIRWSVFERDNFTCVECGSRRELEADHIFPVSKGGLTILENLQTLCHPCNSRKGAKVKECLNSSKSLPEST